MVLGLYLVPFVMRKRIEIAKLGGLGPTSIIDNHIDTAKLLYRLFDKTLAVGCNTNILDALALTKHTCGYQNLCTPCITIDLTPKSFFTLAATFSAASLLLR
jgi:hypothetical protein